MAIDWKLIWERTIGMKLALWLDKRNPDWCWASLCVNLGMGYDLLHWRARAKQDVGACRQECLGPIEGCYCGKFMSDHLRKQFEKDQADPKATEIF